MHFTHSKLKRTPSLIQFGLDCLEYATRDILTPLKRSKVSICAKIHDNLEPPSPRKTHQTKTPPSRRLARGSRIWDVPWELGLKKILSEKLRHQFYKLTDTGYNLIAKDPISISQTTINKKAAEKPRLSRQHVQPQGAKRPLKLQTHVTFPSLDV